MQQLELRRSEIARGAMMGFASATEVAILTIDVHGVIRFANHAAGALFGWLRR
ncbi:PAS domain-containing protein [Mesorhizobium sp. M1340]|uniref:hypothetical protein n=1 Tax=unclassified Mesorhizobium TaxID=325217 RepID=UPI00333D6BEB